jgi:hypothetical protein
MTSTRMWWLLRDVPPLAEHAHAAPWHHLAGQQVCAGEPSQPALVWTHDAGGDWLSSNGNPIWYDADGHHQAAALTWRHPATGATGTPGQPDPGRGFWPLTHYDHATRWDHQPPLIDVLRRGRRTGAHWLAVTPAPPTRPMGTGSSTTVTTSPPPPRRGCRRR